jgi:citrate lyase beta subunit
MTGRLARSYLSVPADATGRLASATRRGADAVIADLEDAVALHEDGRMVDEAVVRQCRRLLMLTNSNTPSHRDEEEGRR